MIAPSSIAAPTTATTAYAFSAPPQTPTVSAQSTATNDKIDAVSKDFEAVFITQMLQGMFAGDEMTNFFGGGTQGDVYKSYLLNEYGKMMANAGGIGLAKQVKQELLKLQEVPSS